MSSMQLVTAVTISGALIFGMILALFGSLKLAVARRLQLDDGQVRHLRIALNIALIPLMLLSGVLVDNLGVRSVLMAGSVVLSVALVSLSLRPTYPHAFGAILLAAFGVAALSTASIVLMPRAFFSPVETSASLNLGFVFIALGALLTPVLADILLDRVGLRRTLGAFALLALVPAFLAVFPHAEHWQIADHPGDSAALFSEPSSWLAALVFFVYAPLEASISLWTLTLLTERNQDEREAGGLLTGFWIGFLASRLLVAVGRHTDILSETWDRWIVVLPPLMAAVVIGNLAGASHRGRPRGGLILLGLLLGPVFPTLLAMIFRYVAPAEQGLAYGIVFAAGSLGSLLLSPVLTLRTRQPLQTLRVPIFLALLLTAVTLVLGLMTP
ncbi:MAG TPA: MFS transporter [Gemmataceae bacterium]|nr:MFS transporter [Gemmataceae bacterium]